MDLGNWLESARGRLAQTGVEAAFLEAQLLAAARFGKGRAEILAHPEWIADLQLEGLLERRLRGEPLAYIIGQREFFGRQFRVTPAVLIPRQDTETLIDAWAELQKGLPKDARVLDLGTGSGCIGITLKLEYPNLQVTLADVSPDALAIASENARTLGADVRLVASDGLNEFRGERFNAIVTNPPYIGLNEELPKEVREFEPKIALYAGESGEEMYLRLAKESRDHLVPNGTFLTEVGYSQGANVRTLFETEGWCFISSYRDLSGIERALAFRMGEASELVLE